jgi:hypothetical protein
MRMLQPPQSTDSPLMKVPHSIMCLSEHESFITKDQRAFDHDKQRRMNAGAFFKRNAGKGQGGASGTRPVIDTKNAPNPPSTSGKQKHLWEEDADLVYLDDTRVPEDDHFLKRFEADGLSARGAMVREREVKLSDLIAVRKSRKGKGMQISVSPVLAHTPLRCRGGF